MKRTETGGDRVVISRDLVIEMVERGLLKNVAAPGEPARYVATEKGLAHDEEGTGE